jgi:hypothetical protein
VIDGGLRRLFRENVPGHWQSVETGGTGRGVPDSNFCLDGAEGWCEFKIATARAVALRPEQIGWILARVRAGGRVFVAVRRLCAPGPRREARDELWLIRGAGARELRQLGLPGAPEHLCGHWSGGPAHWPWSLVRRLLRS